MTYAQMQDELERLLRLEGWLESYPQPSTDTLINEALQLWSWEAEYVTASVTFPTVAGQAEYDLAALTPPLAPPSWKIFKDVYYGDSELTRSAEDEIRGMDPHWGLATSGTPSRYFMIRPNTLRFYSPPNSVQTVTIYGIAADTDLVAATDVPKCPAHYHRNIPRLAAWMFGEGFAQGESAARIDGYYNKAMAAARDLQLWAASQNQRGLQRTVKGRGIPRAFSIAEDNTVVRSV